MSDTEWPEIDGLARRIRVLRQKKGLNQNQLAQSAGVDQKNLWRLEEGLASNPTLKTLLRIAFALEVSIERLLGHDEPKGAGEHCIPCEKFHERYHA